MAYAWRDEVRQDYNCKYELMNLSYSKKRLTECIVEYSLSAKDQCTHEDPWLSDGQEAHEVHSLIFSFFKQCVNPASVSSLLNR